MTNLNFTCPISHPTITYLTLTLATLAFASDNLSLAEEANTPPPTSTTSLRYINVDPRLLPTLLPPMSRLIPSPYSNASAIDNPLAVVQKVTTKSEVIKSVISRQDPTSPTSTSLEESFKAESESPKVRLPRVSDFMLTSPLSFQVEPTTKLGSIGAGRSFAMTVR